MPGGEHPGWIPFLPVFCPVRADGACPQLRAAVQSVDLLVPGATCQLPLQPSTARPAAGSGRSLENQGIKWYSVEGIYVSEDR